MTDEIIDLRAIQNKVNPKLIGALVILVIVVMAFLSSFFQVDQTEEAVLLRLGKFNRIEGPGLHWKLPLGIETAYKVPTQRILKEEFGFRTERAGIKTLYSSANFSAESVMLTGDLNIADVTWIIQFKINDPKAWLFNVEDQRKTIRDISQSVINQLVGDLAVFDVVTTERANIEEKGQTLMNKLFKHYELGIEVKTVKLQKTMYPKGPVQDAFEDVNKAIQDRIRLINEGKEAYNNSIPKARGEAQKTIQEAEGYATEKINKAKGDVARFLAVYGEYKKNPGITRIRLYYEMFEDIFEQTDNIDLIDKELKNFIPFKSLSQPGAQQGGK